MKTADFVSDVVQVEAWLKSVTTPLVKEGVYISSWFHSNVYGFGVHISDALCESSGEFHLMPDGNVTRYIKKLGKVVLDEHVEVTEFEAFVDLFNDFKGRILYSAPLR